MLRERSFRDYVAERFYNELYDGIREFIKDNLRDVDLKLYRVQDIDEIELSDIRVVYVDVHDQPRTSIFFDRSLWMNMWRAWKFIRGIR